MHLPLVTVVEIGYRGPHFDLALTRLSRRFLGLRIIGDNQVRIDSFFTK